MDIEERAEKWAREFITANNVMERISLALKDAYLAGSAQTQADYVEHYERKNNADT